MFLCVLYLLQCYLLLENVGLWLIYIYIVGDRIKIERFRHNFLKSLLQKKKKKEKHLFGYTPKKFCAYAATC